MKVVIFAVVGLILLGAGVFVGMKFLAPSGTEPGTEVEKVQEEAEAVSEDIVVYPLDTFVVNLSGGGGRRYLKVRMTLEIDGSKKESLDSQSHKVRDSLLILLSSKTLEEVVGAEVKHALKEQVKARLDRIAGKGVVREVYLNEFVVQ